MQVNKTVLDNGVRVVSMKMPHLRSVSMGVWVNVGARDESESENGLSHFIEHMIFKGTSRRSAYQIAKEFDAIGGQTNAFTGMENTCYYAKVIDSHLESMVDILSDIFLNSLFDEKEMENERPIIFQEIGMIEDNPEDFVHVLSERAYWGDHSLGRPIIGTRENVIRFDANIIRDFFHRLYQSGRIVISIAGNVDHDQFVKLITPSFGSIQRRNGFLERTTPQGQSRIAIHGRDLGVLHVCVETQGISVTDPRRFAFSLMNTIAGGNMSSRLFQEIRERKGFAYSVYSYSSSYMDTGAFGIYAGVRPDSAMEAIPLILKQIDQFKSEPVSDTELRNAKEFIKGNLLLNVESSDNQMVRLAQNEIHFGQYFPLNNALEKIEAVTADEIHQLANELFGNNQITLTLLGPVADEKPFKEMIAL